MIVCCTNRMASLFVVSIYPTDCKYKWARAHLETIGFKIKVSIFLLCLDDKIRSIWCEYAADNPIGWSEASDDNNTDGIEDSRKRGCGEGCTGGWTGGSPLLVQSPSFPPLSHSSCPLSERIWSCLFRLEHSKINFLSQRLGQLEVFWLVCSKQQTIFLEWYIIKTISQYVILSQMVLAKKIFDFSFCEVKNYEKLSTVANY